MESDLRLVLFHTFINDLAEELNSEVMNFADDRAVRKRTDCKELQKDLTRLSDSAMKKADKILCR